MTSEERAAKKIMDEDLYDIPLSAREWKRILFCLQLAYLRGQNQATAEAIKMVDKK